MWDILGSLSHSLPLYSAGGLACLLHGYQHQFVAAARSGQAMPATGRRVVTQSVHGCDISFLYHIIPRKGGKQKAVQSRSCCWVFGDGWAMTSILRGGKPLP